MRLSNGIGWLGFVLVIVIATAVLTGRMRRYALHTGLIDHPNERSSHQRPTPRGGGLAIVVTSMAGICACAVLGIVPTTLAVAVVGGGIAVATVGYLDDRYHLAAGARLSVHFAAALWALFWLGRIPALGVSTPLISFSWLGYAVGAFGIVWALNLFNFMDGIDGIAGSEGGFVTLAGAALGYLAGMPASVPAASLAVAAASVGFLIWNWPPAKIFMGDVGSGYLGYVIAVLAIAASREDPAAVLAWIILGGVFFVDATVTLLRRIARGERIHVAHRSHAYQWVARRWQSHRRTTVAVTLVNLVWLLPCAWLALLFPKCAGWITAAALLPLAGLALAAGSGRREN